jgi:FkbM family methyltransferase
MSLTETFKFILNHPLNRNGRLRALERYLRWQIGSRILPGPVVLKWVGGAKLMVRPGDTGITQNIYCGLQDFAEMAYLLHVLTPRDLFVDVGANVGAYTVLACTAKGARGYCFEPVPSTFVRLRDNLLINDLSSRVTALNLGVADKEGELTFTSSGGTLNHVATDGDQRVPTVSVPVRTLDQLLAGESPSFLKIDVEGFETAVLRGAECTLSNPALHSILIELNGAGSKYGFDEASIVRMLNDYGFSSYLYDPLTRELSLLASKNETSDNTLFLRGESEVQERLRQAPRFRIGSTDL